MAYDPRWPEAAEAEAARLRTTLDPIVLAIHHVGSTAVVGLTAKPILDLIPVVTSLDDLDRRRGDLEAIGFEWWGELGLPERRYATRSDPVTGRRLVHLHAYAVSCPEIDRHLAFRNYLRSRPDIAREYDWLKAKCQRLHPHDSHAYGDCKSAWIENIEAAASSDTYARVLDSRADRPVPLVRPFHERR